MSVTAEYRPRIRDVGVEPGILAPGPLNAIADVERVLVGHVRTGVTAILPRQGNVFQEKVSFAAYVAHALAMGTAGCRFRNPACSKYRSS